jgi:glycine betaine/choline ABC-type transport system substrate-binding protein
MRLERIQNLVLLILAAAVVTGCGNSGRIVVASKNFTEQLILGEILAQHIENRLQAAVDRKLNLGGTLVAHQALLSGAVDLYPEYTGTALMAILDLPPESDAGAVFDRVGSEYAEKFHAAWLPPLGFNNSFAMVVPGDLARRNQLDTLSDAARYPDGWTLGVGYEFESRVDGLPALNKTYGLKWKDPPKTMDLGLLYQALQQGQVTMVSANGTDGLLAKLDVTVLKDDREAFPPYEAAVVVREEALREHAGLREALSELSGTLDEATLRALNYQVDGEQKTPRNVAADFLRSLSVTATETPATK